MERNCIGCRLRGYNDLFPEMHGHALNVSFGMFETYQTIYCSGQFEINYEG